jgi:hypothetical protein
MAREKERRGSPRTPYHVQLSVLHIPSGREFSAQGHDISEEGIRVRVTAPDLWDLTPGDGLLLRLDPVGQTVFKKPNPSERSAMIVHTRVARAQGYVDIGAKFLSQVGLPPCL